MTSRIVRVATKPAAAGEVAKPAADAPGRDPATGRFLPKVQQSS